MGFLKNSLIDQKWASVSFSLLISGMMILWAIFVNEKYGMALFFVIPLLIGIITTLLYGFRNPIKLGQAMIASIQTLFILLAMMFLFAMEGLICILMAAPIAVVFTVVGTFIGYAFINHHSEKTTLGIFIVCSSFPAVSMIEKDNSPDTIKITSSIVIDAQIETVWNNVLSFPRLKDPEELMFKAGIAYPIEAKIEGEGLNAVRYCHFNTGSFVEPITVYNPPYLLRFSVDQQPAAMKELSFWDIDAPHLHDYFVSEQGQFKLSPLPGGKTLLEGSTWYNHNISPQFYWQWWSDQIIHRIHYRVLEHIKVLSED